MEGTIRLWFVVSWIKELRQKYLDKKADEAAFEKYSKMDVNALMRERYDVYKIESPHSFDSSKTKEYMMEIENIAKSKIPGSPAYINALKAVEIIKKRVEKGFISESQMLAIIECNKELRKLRGDK